MPAVDSSQSYAAARTVCRRTFGDLFFAAHFLSRRQRAGLFTLAAVWDQLRQIMTPTADDGANTGGCGCDSVPERRRVAGQVLDHLYRGEATGKAELDGFADLLALHPLPRPLFDEILDAMVDHHEQRRYATWTRLYDTSNRLAGSTALLGWALLASSQPHPTVAAQVRSLGVAMHLTRMLLRLGEDGRAGRVLMPLEDLVRFQLSDRDIVRIAEARGGASTDRIASFMQYQVQRLENLYAGGLKCVGALEDAASRRAVTVLVQLSLRQLDRMASGRVNAFASPPQVTLWQRLRDAMRVLR